MLGRGHREAEAPKPLYIIGQNEGPAYAEPLFLGIGKELSVGTFWGSRTGSGLSKPREAAPHSWAPLPLGQRSWRDSLSLAHHRLPSSLLLCPQWLG